MKSRQSLLPIPADAAGRRRRSAFRTALPARCAVLLAVLLPLSAAHAAPFTLGAFDYYGLLVNNGVAGGDINTDPVNANIGIGDITGSINLHDEVVNGRVDVSGSAASKVSGAAISGTQPASRGGATGGSPATVNSFVSRVQDAITAAMNLWTTFGAKSGSGTAVTIAGTTTLDASSGWLDPATGARIFTAPGFKIGNGNTVTINGTAADYVVIDVTGSSGNKLDGALTLTGGITADQVLINFIGTGGNNVQGAANKATLSGTFLMPYLSVQLNSLTLDGHLFGGAAGSNFQYVSNALIAQPGLLPPAAVVPEPASLAIVAVGLAGLAATRRRSAASGRARG